MAQKAFTHQARIDTPDLVDGSRPTRSVFRLRARRPGRMSLALLGFSLKEIPLWFLPVVTAQIIDIVGGRYADLHATQVGS